MCALSVHARGLAVAVTLATVAPRLVAAQVSPTVPPATAPQAAGPAVLGGPPPAPAPTAQEASVAAVQAAAGAPAQYTREVFAYPRLGRLDPVAPPPEVFRRDRFPALSVSGIVFDAEHPTQSAAMMVVQRIGADGKPVGTGVRRLVRAGDTFEAYTVVRIGRNDVVINKSILGRIERLVLKKSVKRVRPMAADSTAVADEAAPQRVMPRRPDRPRAIAPLTGTGPADAAVPSRAPAATTP